MAQPMTSCMSEPMMASSTINHRMIRGTCTDETDFGQVHPGDHAEPSRQPLQQQPDDGGGQQHPEELAGGEQTVTFRRHNVAPDPPSRRPPEPRTLSHCGNTLLDTASEKGSEGLHGYLLSQAAQFSAHLGRSTFGPGPKDMHDLVFCLGLCMAKEIKQRGGVREKEREYMEYRNRPWKQIRHWGLRRLLLVLARDTASRATCSLGSLSSNARLRGRGSLP
ncbi:hypothetical protein EYF80_016523 [Liparis tanakae]|uniref:Uncharacterized protein n=1 Tax=Liparis tanakae TaxID=230148 RepID=A0A4Z2I6C4_9TELE|nr:hypothetical protein EYF80_016523 [Liparis tanakae]